MKPRILIVISADPRATPRAAEAVRIAAGVGAWEKVDLSVYLEGPAVLLLNEEGNVLGGEDLSANWRLLRESGHKIYFQTNTGARTLLSECEKAPLAEAISTERLAQLSAQSSYLLHF